MAITGIGPRIFKLINTRRDKYAYHVQKNGLAFELRDGRLFLSAITRGPWGQRKIAEAVELALDPQVIQGLLLKGIHQFTLPAKVSLEQVEAVCRGDLSSVASGIKYDYRSSVDQLVKGVGDPNGVVKVLIDHIPQVKPEHQRQYYETLKDTFDNPSLTPASRKLILNAMSAKVASLEGSRSEGYFYWSALAILQSNNISEADYGVEVERLIALAIQNMNEKYPAGANNVALDYISFISSFFARNQNVSWVAALSSKYFRAICDNALAKSKEHAGDQMVVNRMFMDLVRDLGALEGERGYLEGFIPRVSSYFIEALQSGSAADCARLIDGLTMAGAQVIGLKDRALVYVIVPDLVRPFEILSSKRFEATNSTGKYSKEDYDQIDQLKRASRHAARQLFELITKNPQEAAPLMVRLTFILKNEGFNFADYTLIQGEISRLLHCDLAPIWHIARQLIKAIPYSWREIGVSDSVNLVRSSGDKKADPSTMRKVSEDVDRLGGNKGILHLLRVQIHSSSSKQNVDLMDKIFEFWMTGNAEIFKKLETSEAFLQLMAEEGKRGHTRASLIGYEKDQPQIQVLFAALARARGLDRLGMDDLYEISMDQARQVFDKCRDVSHVSKEKTMLMLHLYQLIRDKYGVYAGKLTDEVRHSSYCSGYNSSTVSKELAAAVDAYEKDPAAETALALMRQLHIARRWAKRKLQAAGEFDEDIAMSQIYEKRHVAPFRSGTWGTYSEPKFDLFNLDRILEDYQNLIIEKIFGEHFANLSKESLPLFLSGMYELILATFDNGIGSTSLLSLANMLKISSISRSQVRDLSAMLARQCRGVVDRLNSEYRFGRQVDDQDAIKREETFMGNLVAGEVGFKRFGGEVDRLRLFLNGLLEVEGDGYLYEKHAPSLGPVELMPVIGQWDRKDLPKRYFLGGKAANLFRMRQEGLPVPEGFTISAEFFKRETPKGQVYDQHLKEGVDRRNFKLAVQERIAGIEEGTGKKFGGDKNPLIFSVRSGSVISMPGQMETITNVGLNDVAVGALEKETGNKWFAYDCYRRFIQSYAMGVHGISRKTFHQIIETYKKGRGVRKKSELTGDDMQQIAQAYGAKVESLGYSIPQGPVEQLWEAIWAVNRSWYSERATSYRKNLGISDRWGTGISVQVMKFGNRNDKSLTGVLLTHDPITGQKKLQGSFKYNAQGNDVVDGVGGSILDLKDLRCKAPEVYHKLVEGAEKVLNRLATPQEMEITVEATEAGSLEVYFLQTRDLNIQHKPFPVFDEAALSGMRYIGLGAPIAGGAFRGRVILDPAEMIGLNKKAPARKMGEIGFAYFANDLVPEDIELIIAGDAFLIRQGSPTSHAAITLRPLGKTGIVFPGFDKQGDQVRIGDLIVRKNEIISFDGRTGRVFLGRAPLLRDASGALILK
ncbi:MAG: PEP/pyruvate-binding domain-containing protein [Candidatus Margulisiibacteriota bacterium]|nr:PEP/pyruvate-binding domain-containing protein [Candidatus Margulisiibacteriota bacterium]